MSVAVSAPAQEPVQAGFGLRVGAKLIDHCLLGVVEIAALAATAYLNARGVPPWVLAAGYVLCSVLWYVYVYELTRRRGQTVGKMVAAIRVQMPDGALPDAGHVLRRTLGEALFDFSYVYLGIAFWWLASIGGFPVVPATVVGLSVGGLVALIDPLRVALRPDRRAVHDLLGGTEVVRTGARRVRRFWPLAVAAFLIPQGLMLGVGRPFLVEAYVVPSGSMEPTIEIGDRILSNKLVRHLRPPRNGEIIMFQAPEWVAPGPKPTVFVKRVVGVAGDRLHVRDGELYRNGEPVDEPYIMEPPRYEWPLPEPGDEEQAGEPPSTERVEMPGGTAREEGVPTEGGEPEGGRVPAAARPEEVVVPEGHVVVFGDNRNNSNDSHLWERISEDQRSAQKAPFVPVEAIRGKLCFRFWPPTRIGTVAQGEEHRR